MGFDIGFQRLGQAASLAGFLQTPNLLAHVGGASHLQFVGYPFLACRGLLPDQPGKCHLSDAGPFAGSEILWFEPGYHASDEIEVGT